MNLERLAAALEPVQVRGSTEIEVRDLAYDARAAAPGSLFFCVPGARADGHDFARDAVAGVTGTSGKTTTTFLLFAILAAAGKRPGLLGTIEARVGGERRGVVRTTPEAIDLQYLGIPPDLPIH